MEKNEILNKRIIDLPDAPKVPGLIYRHFQGEADYPGMSAIVMAICEAGLMEGSFTAEDMANEYRHLTNCDLSKDLIIAELDGSIIAYGRAWWAQEKTGKAYYMLLDVLPEKMDLKIAAPMLCWMESRAQDAATAMPADYAGDLLDVVDQKDTAKITMLKEFGYQPVRYYFAMERDLENIPDIPLPEGIVARPAMPSQYHEVWDKAEEAFSEHWGFTEPTEENYQGWKESRWFQPFLWQIAWDGNLMVGQVQNYVDMVENEREKRLRGYTEGISTLKGYRGRGIASALIARSLKMMKALNLDELALSVDSSNATGALRLYEALGYRTYRKMVEYRKPLLLND